jgi:hypothetical protein
MTSRPPSRFFTRLKQMPVEIQTRIWADYFRLAAEEHADRFADIHDELGDYSLRVQIGNRIKLTLCRANCYYSIVDIEDLWLNPYIYKYALEAQVKCDCLRLLEGYKGRRINQPTVRFGDVIVELAGEYIESGRQLGYYLDRIPGVRDYAEDVAAYTRRWRTQIEWLAYKDGGPSIAYINGSGVSMNGRGVSGRGPAGFDSGTNLGSDGGSESSSSSSLSDSEDSSSDANSTGESDEEETWFGAGTGTDTGASGGDDTG